MIIDTLTYNSHLRYINPFTKFVFTVSAIIICIAANSFSISVLTALSMLFLIIFKGKTPAKNVFALMRIPMVFIIFSAAAIALSVGKNDVNMLTAIRIKGLFIGVSREGLMLALITMAKCFGAVSCMYFLSLTTPMIDLFTLLRKSIIPNSMVEITELVYRYIFVLFDAAQSIRTAQDARLGYYNIRVAYRSTSELASQLFMRAFRQAEKTYIAMDSRGYNGEINVPEPKFAKNPWFIVFAAAYIAVMICAAVFCKEVGI